MASPGLIAWGFWIAAVTCGVMHWRDLKIVEKVILVIFLLSILNFEHSNFGYLLAQIGVVTAVLIFVLTFKVFKKAVANEAFVPAG